MNFVKACSPEHFMSSNRLKKTEIILTLTIIFLRCIAFVPTENTHSGQMIC